MKEDCPESGFVYFLRKREDKILEGVEEDPVITLLDNLLYNAINSSASDIHFEPHKFGMGVRYRIDGVLHEQEPVSFAQRFLVISRLKVLSSLDIAESRLPQDGKFPITLVSKEKGEGDFIDLRISTFPSIYGEKMVVRILDRKRDFIEISSLGFNSFVLEKVKEISSKTQGFFLVCGPTGSGKTTTLYVILSGLNSWRCNIITMEDPVEYHIERITQSQVNLKAGFTFENGMRSILRQDPDVIMVGEIRDRPTVQMAIEAALTGHLVLSSLHTNNAAGAITRLIEMGVEPYLISASLSGVLAQRLVRRLCDYCKQEAFLDENEKEQLKKYDIHLEEVFKAKGCPSCLNIGYKGRVAIAELILVNDEIRDLINRKASSSEIEKSATQNGTILLQEELTFKLKSGVISLEEFLCVIN